MFFFFYILHNDELNRYDRTGVHQVNQDENIYSTNQWMILTFEAQWCFMAIPWRMLSGGGLCGNCVLRSVHVGWNGLFVYVSLAHECVRETHREKSICDCVHAVGNNFRCPPSRNPAGFHTDRSSCSFTSSWCSFCSTSWSTPGCCLQNALMQRTPAEKHGRKRTRTGLSDC